MGCVLAPKLKKKTKKKEKKKKKDTIEFGKPICNPSWGQCWSI